jgi:hypothetical protein
MSFSVESQRRWETIYKSTTLPWSLNLKLNPISKSWLISSQKKLSFCSRYSANVFICKDLKDFQVCIIKFVFPSLFAFLLFFLFSIRWQKYFRDLLCLSILSLNFSWKIKLFSITKCSINLISEKTKSLEVYFLTGSHRNVETALCDQVII